MGAIAKIFFISFLAMFIFMINLGTIIATFVLAYIGIIRILKLIYPETFELV